MLQTEEVLQPPELHPRFVDQVVAVDKVELLDREISAESRDCVGSHLVWQK